MIDPAIHADSYLRAKHFKIWQWRILLGALLGYTFFYFVRNNFNIALPAMEKELGFSKAQLGTFLTLHGLLYGLSKFLNGILVDRFNARWFMVAGLTVSALINVAFGFSVELTVLGLLWTANGWFQGMGFPPSARLMTHWFPPKILATKMSLWNTSHCIGAALVAVLCGYLVAGHWQNCFFVPAGLALVVAALIALILRDTPESLGFPETPGTENPERLGTWATLTKYVFTNPWIWLISLANFQVYIVRYGMCVWGPSYLQQAKQFSPSDAGWTVGAIEVAGMFGAIFGGWMTDRYFGGRAARTCIVCMLACGGCLGILMAVPVGTPIGIEIALMVAAGFFMYGPQCLVGIMAANLGTKKAAATAGGMTGFFGYLSAVPAGTGVGWLADHHGWDAGFFFFIASALAGAGIFAVCWNAPPNGYEHD